MAKPISFADLDEVGNKLKKARGVLAMVQDGTPASGMDDIGWALSAAFDYVHYAMQDIERLIEEATKK